MALSLDDNHIICYYMDVQWLIGFTETYFDNPDYLLVQCWVCATFLSPDTMNQTESYVYNYTTFFEGTVGYTPLGFPCTRPMAVISPANCTALCFDCLSSIIICSFAQFYNVLVCLE